MPRSPSRKARREDKVEIAFLEAVHRRCRQNRRVWEALGDLYTRVGRYDDGLAMDLRLTASNPDDPLAWYNLGCSYALTGRADDALQALARAIRAGYRDWEWMSRDRDLKSLHGDPRFQALIHRLQHLHDPPKAR